MVAAIELVSFPEMFPRRPPGMVFPAVPFRLPQPAGYQRPPEGADPDRHSIPLRQILARQGRPEIIVLSAYKGSACWSGSGSVRRLDGFPWLPWLNAGTPPST
jgi:hypothetical protein